MSYTRDNIIWLAGLLEGEGNFRLDKNCPRITLNMTDKDVVEKVHNIFGGNFYIQDKSKYKSNWNICYSLTINGERAIGIMLSIYTLMGQRRKTKIKEIVGKWKTLPAPVNQKITSRIADFIREDYTNGISYNDLAIKYNLSYAGVWSVINGKTWNI